jgi:hypothetical protein
VATVEREHGELVVKLSGMERLAAMRGDVRVPLSEVRAVSHECDPWGCLRGVRAPGTGFPGMVAYGVRRLTGGRPDFTAVHGCGPAVRVDLGPGAPFGRLIVTVDDPDATVSELRACLSTPAPG